MAQHEDMFQVGLLQLKNYYGPANSGIPMIFLIFAAFMFLGGLFTLCLPETRRRTLEDIAANPFPSKNSMAQPFVNQDNEEISIRSTSNHFQSENQRQPNDNFYLNEIRNH